MSLACINCFMVPLEVAVDLDNQLPKWYKMIVNAIDFLFILDIFINFNTSCEINLQPVYSRKRIARNYIKKKSFIIDVLSAVPIDTISKLFLTQNTRKFKAFSILKIMRMLRLSRIIRALNVQRKLKSKVKLL